MKKKTIVFLSIIGSAVLAGAQEPLPGGALDSLVATERAFAAAGLADGIRASFMKFFSDSAIAFSPAPYVFKEVVGTRPPPADPHARTLRWEPIAGDIAASADLGYLMGPSRMTDNTAQHAPPSYGFYLSVWRRQGDGTWKVALDVGTEATETVMRDFGTPFRALGKEGPPARPRGESSVRDRSALFRLDSTLSEGEAARGVGAAYATLLDPDARALRDGIGPIIGRGPILAHLDTLKSGRFLSPIGGGLSRAGDLGYTYGAYRSSAGAASPSGYYVHIWKKTSRKSWHLVVDKESPAANP